MNIGIISTGGFAKLHSELVEEIEGARFVSVCGTSLEKAEQFASSFSSVKGYGHIEEM